MKMVTIKQHVICRFNGLSSQIMYRIQNVNLTENILNKRHKNVVNTKTVAILNILNQLTTYG